MAATKFWPEPYWAPFTHSELKTQIRARDFAPTTVQNLQGTVVAEWTNIPQKSVMILIRSMKDRMGAVIGAKGGNTN